MLRMGHGAPQAMLKHMTKFEQDLDTKLLGKHILVKYLRNNKSLD